MYNQIRAHIVLANSPCRFGWVNSSYILGYKLMDIQMRRAIDLTVPWEDYNRGIRGPVLEDVVGEQVALELAAAAAVVSSDDESAVVDE